MNERIGKLAEQAGLLGPSSRIGNAHEATEKFAELIVRECIDIAGKEDFDVMMKEGYPCSQTAKKIREHFGVEE
jgi:hypothetical protein